MRISLFIAIIAVCFILTACYTHVHTVGNGPQTYRSATARQWYAVYGLAPINNVDTHAMAGDAADYEIKTQQTFVDSIISMFTSAFTVTCQTVTVTK